MSSFDKSLFCFGHGYTCTFLEKALSRQPTQWKISGTTRDEERLSSLKAQNIHPYLFDRNNPLPDAEYLLKDTTHLLISTPPDDDGDPTFLTHHLDIQKLKNLEWIGYLSTTGVYGDREGRWVDETSQVNPTSRRGKRRKKAEDQWLSLYQAHGLPVHIFRLAGIYGPRRNAMDSVRAGLARRILKRNHSFGRIHVDDIVGALLRSFKTPTPGEVYNLCDDLPAPSHEVIEYACELLNVKPPPLIDFEDANLAPMTRSFYADNRKVRNHKIKHDLHMEFKYPDYKSGLKACLEAEQQDKQKAAQNGTNIPAIFKR